MKKIKFISEILVFAFVFYLTISALFIVIEADHDCHEHNCQVCFHIQHIANTMKRLFALPFCPAILLFLSIAFSRVKHIGFIALFMEKITLVKLKTILNN
ncbi:MAG: hypothetical protein LBQ37_02850 [Elusimicrobiota bacterium]|nr:hypothetical protein [Elusimicrobiota bacterium]